MAPQTKARLIAAVALPLLALNVATARAAPPARTASVETAPIIQMDHISVEVVGSGPAVILIPGLASPRAVWDGVTPMVARTHTVYRVQVNGFGGSAPGANLAPGVIAGVVADLHTLIARRRLTGVPVIGHSMGGLAAMMLARDHPADVGRLMIVDALPWFAVLMAPPGVELTQAMVEPRARTMRDSVAAGYGKPLSDAAAQAQTRGLALRPTSIASMTAWAKTADARVTAQAMYEDMTTDLRTDLPRIAAPITLIYPWNAQAPREMVEPFYRRQFAHAPHVTFVPIGDSAHFVMLDQPAAFAAAVTDFLK